MAFGTYPVGHDLFALSHFVYYPSVENSQQDERYETQEESSEPVDVDVDVIRVHPQIWRPDDCNVFNYSHVEPAKMEVENGITFKKDFSSIIQIDPCSRTTYQIFPRRINQ